MVLPWRRGGRVGHRRNLILTPLNEGFFLFEISDCEFRISDLKARSQESESRIQEKNNQD